MERQSDEKKFLCGEDVIQDRLLGAYDALVMEEIERRRKMDLPPPEEFEFDEEEIIAMDSELNLPEQTWDTAYLPPLLTDNAFESLVRSGEFQQTIVYDVNYNAGEEDGIIFKKYKRPNNE